MKRNIDINLHSGWTSLLGVIFVVLKVAGITQVAEWSWWLVLLPFYIGWVILAAVLGLMALGGGCLLAFAGLLTVADWVYWRWKKAIRKKQR